MTQCGYPVTIHTNKDYCVGSSLIATSTHAMQKIVWYRNGQPVSTVTGQQSLSTQPTQLPVSKYIDSVQASFGDIRLGADDSGNVYILYDVGKLIKTKVDGTSAEIMYIPPIGAGGMISGMTVDPAGNVYLASWTDLFSPTDTTLVWKVPAGTTLSTPIADLPTVMPLSAIPDDSVSAFASFVDCNNNIYLYQPNGKIYHYTPGAATATLVGAGYVSWSLCDAPLWYYGEIQTDPAGNIFFIDGSYVMELPAGATTPVVVVQGNCTENYGRLISDFWMDANDTIYLSVYDQTGNSASIEKWAPGATTPQQLFNWPMQKDVVGEVPITMDCQGNIFVGYNSSPNPVPNLYEYKRTSSIDSAFTPADTGGYYAVVTDIRGYTTNSDTIHINDPTAGPPSVRITATATSTPVCTPITFTAQVTNPGADPAYQWQVSGVPAGGDSTTYSYNLFANGDQVYCILSAQAGCTGPQKDTSNIIDLTIDPEGAASVTIATPKDPICQGDAATFTATVANGSNAPAFQWLLNGDSTIDDSATYTRNNFSNGDVVTCLITSDDACGLAKSNSITMAVSARPTVENGQIYTILHGQSVTLDPAITGDISSYLWTPATGLSDPTIASPVADPAANTYYTLTVTAAGGCSDSGTMLVNVYTPLSIPNAFTPNGDGRNDIFYVLGGPVNSEVEDFAVYERYGVQVFHVHDVAPGDPSKGWNGYFHGTPAPLGTYVYSVVMKMGDGSRQGYKGTVILIR
jgi:gliding motility-associated-like protein